MATAITEPPHVATDLKSLRLSTVASQWQPSPTKPSASLRRRPTAWRNWSTWRSPHAGSAASRTPASRC